MPWPCTVHHLCCRPFPDHRKAPPRSPGLYRWPSSLPVIQIHSFHESNSLSHMLMVNDSKKEFLIVGSKQQLERVNIPFIHVGADQITLWRQCETWVWFWLQLENGYANHKSLPKRLLSSPQHQENPKIPEPGGHVHDYTCIYYKPDWLLQQFDEWTIRESHQETPACAKHSCQTSFQSEEIWSHNSRIRYASLASSQIPDWIQNTIDRLQRTSWQGTYLHPRNDHPIKKQKIFHKIQWRTCPEGSKIQAWYFSASAHSQCMGLWHGIACQGKIGYVMKLKHSSET